MNKFLSFFILLFFLISFANPQSLAEVAKKEKERRKKIKKKVPIITNKTLGKIKKREGYGYIISSNTGNSAHISRRGATEGKEIDSPFNKNNYESWGKKYRELVHKIKVAEDLFKQRKKELDALIFRFKITNNPNEKFALPKKISEKEKEVAKANENLKKLKKELEDFKENARRAGVPPGYLR